MTCFVRCASVEFEDGVDGGEMIDVAEWGAPVCVVLMSEIHFYNRARRRMEVEHVYGERALRWTYQTVPGRLALHALVKRAFFSRWYGRCMDAPASRRRIQPFIEQYEIDEEEMLEPVSSFESFNAFFTRRLKPEARPIDGAEEALVFPADGRHLVIPDVGVARDFFVKGIRFDLRALVADHALAEKFKGGSLLISRLCPVDYHRFHFPVGGVAAEPVLIEGSLFSVNPLALARRPSILWENKRYRTLMEAGVFGCLMLLEVGATCVGTVVHTARAGAPVFKGDEKGYFRFGGSCVITVLEAGRVRWAEDLLEYGARGIEVYARMGDRAATLVG